MKLNLLDKRVVVKVEGVKSSIIIIPANSRESKEGLVGEVIDAGPLCAVVEPGDKVLYAKYSGFLLPFPRDEVYQNCRLMDEEDILAVITEED